MPKSLTYKNFLPHIRCVATIPCESLRHKSKTFHTILALCTCLYRSHLGELVSMKQAKQSRKSEAQNLCWKCPPFTRKRAFKRLRHCAIAVVMMMWSSSLQPSTPSADVLSTPSHHRFANGRPSLEGYPRCCSPPDLNLANWVATSLEG